MLCHIGSKPLQVLPTPFLYIYLEWSCMRGLQVFLSSTITTELLTISTRTKWFLLMEWSRFSQIQSSYSPTSRISLQIPLRLHTLHLPCTIHLVFCRRELRYPFAATASTVRWWEQSWYLTVIITEADYSFLYTFFYFIIKTCSVLFWSKNLSLWQLQKSHFTTCILTSIVNNCYRVKYL